MKTRENKLWHKNAMCNRNVCKNAQMATVIYQISHIFITQIHAHSHTISLKIKMEQWNSKCNHASASKYANHPTNLS